MHIVRITTHPTATDLVVAKTPPTMADIMGRFEPARRSRELDGYLVSTHDLDAFGRFLRIHSIAISDERSRPGSGARYTAQAFACMKCECGYTQRECEEDCGKCNQCHDCGSGNLWSHTVLLDEQREINRRGLELVKPLLRRWPLDVEDDPPEAKMEGAA